MKTDEVRTVDKDRFDDVGIRVAEADLCLRPVAWQ